MDSSNTTPPQLKDELAKLRAECAAANSDFDRKDITIMRREMLMLAGRFGSSPTSKKRASSISTPSGVISPPA